MRRAAGYVSGRIRPSAYGAVTRCRRRRDRRRRVRPPGISAANAARDQNEFHSPHLADVEVTQGLGRLVRTGEVSHVDLLTREWKLRENRTAYDAVSVALAEALEAPNRGWRQCDGTSRGPAACVRCERPQCAQGRPVRSARGRRAEVFPNLCECDHHHHRLDRTLVESGTHIETLRVV